ncbi:hypothetical protein E2K93_17145 [Thalassotalea sp. HSM 43]|uniref:colicin immunity domain-containing protein n=1 Tax=Thalassotalea sp. HSM 43 TaxID=2552945 RepID=UPI0010821E74|nr:colicin immunity domain-containing protein [Thalassotalea sp. HSM 43]QBY05984.1 hypothetical protein E2K93_17145 [Thalassotalea sp. HSM 43]
MKSAYNKLLNKDKIQLAFAPWSLILANYILPVNRALAVQGYLSTMEDDFKSLVISFLKEQLTETEFMTSFIKLWNESRDSGALSGSDPVVTRILDRIFTSCDAFELNPEPPFEIGAIEFKAEVKDMAYLAWGL